MSIIGIHPQLSLDGVKAHLGDNGRGVGQQLKSRVCFVQANLVDLQQLPVRNMDVIFCHNVLIYFTKQVQFSVLDELVTRLRPGGVLIIGSAEAQGWQNSDVKKIEHEAVQAFLKCME